MLALWSLAFHSQERSRRMDAEVFTKYQPMVHRMARKIAATYGLPVGVDADDLESAGLIALAEAWSRYDHSRGTAFEAYACIRIRGAIIDCIRDADWVPRKTRTRVRQSEEARQQLRDQLGREPSSTEVSALSGVKELGQVTRLVSLDSFVECSATSNSDVTETLEMQETLQEIPIALESLNERDRLVVTLHYFQGVPLGQIAGLLGITDSRVSQLHARAINGLKQTLGAA